MVDAFFSNQTLDRGVGAALGGPLEQAKSILSLGVRITDSWRKNADS